MAELAIGQLIKIILGILVFVAVVLGVYFVFKNYVFDFIGGVGPDNSSVNLVFSLL